MSNEQVKRINKVFRTAVITLAAAIAIGALFCNHAHLFTAAIVFAIGLEAEIVKADEFKLRK
jgi:hypothetical protein